MADVTNRIKNKLHPITGEHLAPRRVTTWRDGSAMVDAKCGGLYNKDAVGFFQWKAAGSWPLSRLTTVNQSNLQKLINDYGTESATFVFDKGAVTLTGNLTIPANIQLKHSGTPLFDVPTGMTLTINSTINEGDTVLFTGDGNVVFNGNKKVNSRWLNLLGDETDESAKWTKITSNTSIYSLWIPKPISKYCVNKFSTTSGKFIEIESGTVIEGMGLLGQYDCIWNLVEVSNVVIVAMGVTLRDLRDEYTISTEFQHRHGVRIMSSSNVSVFGLTVEDTGGDGFILGASTFGVTCENITLQQCTTNNIARNGLSITTGDGVYINSCRFLNSHGAAPQSGIDIEPSYYADTLHMIRINNVYTEANYGNGILVAVQPLHLASGNENNETWAPNKAVDIIIDGHTDEGSNWGASVQEVWGRVFGRIQFKDCTWRNGVHGGFYGYNYSSRSARLELIRPTIINPISADDAFWGTFKAAILFHRRNIVNTGTDPIGNIHIEGLILEERRDTPKVTHGIWIEDQKNLNSPLNISIVDPISIIGIPEDNMIVVKNAEVFVSDKHNVLRKSVDADFAMTDLKWKRTIDNFGANAATNVSLENLPAFSRYPRTITFEVLAAQQLRITPTGASILPISPTVSAMIYSNVPGSKITLEKRTSTAWHIVEIIGTWFRSTGEVIRRDDQADVLAKRVTIPNESDLNFWVNTGIYDIPTDAAAATMENSASPRAAQLCVINTGTAVYQEIIETSTRFTYRRSSNAGTSNTITTAWKMIETSSYSITANFNPPSIPHGSTYKYTHTLTGITVGQRINAVCGSDLQGMTIHAYVSATNTVEIVFSNLTGAPVDLGTTFVKLFWFTTP